MLKCGNINEIITQNILLLKNKYFNYYEGCEFLMQLCMLVFWKESSLTNICFKLPTY